MTNTDAILKRNRLILDGAMGTMLLSAGLPAGASPELWNIAKPEAVFSVHQSYLDAGAELIIANTFGANAFRLKKCAHSAGEVAEAGVVLARQACFGRAERLVALDVGPLGELLEPLGELTSEEATQAFRPSIEAGARAGADCILIETMCDVNEALAAIEAARQYGGGLPVFCTLSYDGNGRLMTGMPLESVVAALEEAGVDALGCNCGLGPEQLVKLLPRFLACAHVPLMMSPNAGLPRYSEGKTVYDVSPETFAEQMRALCTGGVWGLGGCCGTTPAHIRALAAMVADAS